MRMIYKYPLEIEDRQVIKVGHNPIIRHVGYQEMILYMWVEVDVDLNTDELIIHIHGTGSSIEGAQFINTVMSPGGYMFHIYSSGWA